MASYVHPRCATVLTANYMVPALPKRFSVLASPTGMGIAMSVVRSLIWWPISTTYSQGNKFNPKASRPRQGRDHC